MKYIDADRLKADIERRLERYDPHFTNAGSELKELLSLIDSLQQEQTSLPSNLDEAAKEYDEAESWCYEALPYPRRAAFIEGAKWMARQMKLK